MCPLEPSQSLQPEQEQTELRELLDLTSSVVNSLPLLDVDRFKLESVVSIGCPASRGSRIERYWDIQGESKCLVLAKHFLTSSPEASSKSRESAWQEIEITLRLSKEASFVCIRCLGAFRDESGDVFLFMEYLPGGDLFQVAAKMSRTCFHGLEREAKVWPLAISLIKAVTALHSIGVAHGDVSLENMLLRDGQVVLIDFESAEEGDLSKVKVTKPGKPAYQAPEIHNDGSYDAKAADLFACGVCIYSLAIGAYPWTSTRDCKSGRSSAVQYMLNNGVEAFLLTKVIRQEDGSRGPVVGKLMSPMLRHLLNILMNPDPAQRFFFTLPTFGAQEMSFEQKHTKHAEALGCQIAPTCMGG